MSRLSSYTIISERLPSGGYALLNGLTGSIDLISDEVAKNLMTNYNFRGSQGEKRNYLELNNFSKYEKDQKIGLDKKSISSNLSLPKDLEDFFTERSFYFFKP
jgi:hypothetical protein